MIVLFNEFCLVIDWLLDIDLVKLICFVGKGIIIGLMFGL